MKTKLKVIFLNLDLVLTSAVLTVLVGLTCISVFSRYIFFHPIVWLEEVQLWCMVWLVYLGAGAVYRNGRAYRHRDTGGIISKEGAEDYRRGGQCAHGIHTAVPYGPGRTVGGADAEHRTGYQLHKGALCFDLFGGSGGMLSHDLQHAGGTISIMERRL